MRRIYKHLLFMAFLEFILFIPVLLIRIAMAIGVTILLFPFFFLFLVFKSDENECGENICKVWEWATTK